MSFIETSKVKISELRPFQKRIDVVFQVVEKGEIREIVSRNTGETHQLCDVVGADETGCVTVALWDENAEKVEVGKTYQISNGYVNLFQGHLRLATGKFGTLEEVDVTFDELNTDNDMSAEEHQDRRRRRRFNDSTSFGSRSSFQSGPSRFGGRRY